LCPSGWVCHAVRAPGSNVTLPAETRLGSCTGKSGSIRTAPVKYSGGPGRDACDPPRVICIVPFLPGVVPVRVCPAVTPADSRTARPALATRTHLRVIMRPFPGLDGHKTHGYAHRRPRP